MSKSSYSLKSAPGSTSGSSKLGLFRWIDWPTERTCCPMVTYSLLWTASGSMLTRWTLWCAGDSELWVKPERISHYGISSLGCPLIDDVKSVEHSHYIDIPVVILVIRGILWITVPPCVDTCGFQVSYHICWYLILDSSSNNFTSQLTHFSSSSSNEVLLKHKLLGAEGIPLEVVSVVFSLVSSPDFNRRVRVWGGVSLLVQWVELVVRQWVV